MIEIFSFLLLDFVVSPPPTIIDNDLKVGKIIEL